MGSKRYTCGRRCPALRLSVALYSYRCVVSPGLLITPFGGLAMLPGICVKILDDKNISSSLTFETGFEYN